MLEDFPIDSFRYLEERLGKLRWRVMDRAAQIAGADAEKNATVYRVEKQHIDAALGEVLTSHPFASYVTGMEEPDLHVYRIEGGDLIVAASADEALRLGSIDDEATVEQLDDDAEVTVCNESGWLPKTKTCREWCEGGGAGPLATPNGT